jgi:hypothetical protein
VRLSVLISICLLLAAGVVFACQVFIYLKTGGWQGVSIIDSILYLGVESDWLINPDSWLGVWKILDTIPLTLFFIGLIFYIEVIEEEGR